MTLKTRILGTDPTSYWPLDDPDGASQIHDACGRNHGDPSGVDLCEVPFGRSQMPHFDGRIGKGITIPNDERYSHAYSNALTVACWIAPSALDFRYTDGSKDQYVYILQKARDSRREVEWGFRLYGNHSNEDCRCGPLIVSPLNQSRRLGAEALSA